MIVNRKLNTERMILEKTPPHKKIRSTMNISQKRAYLSINSAHLYRQILINLYPSRGAIGMRLKRARVILSTLKLTQKLIIGSVILRLISLGVPPISFT